MRKTEQKTPSMKDRPILTILSRSVYQRAPILVVGEGWLLDALQFRIGKEVIWPSRILKGSVWNGCLVPDSDGAFLLEFSTRGRKPGRQALLAESRTGGVRVEAEFRIVPRPDPAPDVPREKYSKPDLRGEAFAVRRIGERADWPRGQYEVFMRDWRRIHRGKRDQTGGGIEFFTAPVPGGCNWVPLGPAPFVNGKGSMFGDESGRIRSIAIDPLTPNRMYVGAASGGVWKSVDGGSSWSPKSDDKFSLAIGALAIDPVATNNVYAGTGEYVPGTTYGGYYGHGLLKSTDHGETWLEVATTELDLAEVARIVINPANPANLFVAASNGLWESATGGTSWTQVSPNPCTDVILVRNPAEAGVERLFVGFQDAGISSASRSGGGTWTAFTAVTSPAFPAGTSKRIVLGVCRDHSQHIYAVFADSTGAMLAAIVRSVDYGLSWTACSLPSGGSNYQSNYNLGILPHPTTPDTVIFTFVQTWKSTNGGGIWSNINVASSGPAIHVDDHAVAYHPTAPDAFFVATDGGLFYSPDLGVSWEARNLDLATLQMYDLGQHPQYESIMIAGSQDNGGFHYSGAPIWKRHWVAPGVTHNAMDGDAVVAQIDPFDGYVHYYGTGPDSTMRRSNDAGKLFTTAWSVWPGTQWWFPFFPDPHTSGVVYSGGFTLQRSEDRGTTWVEITAPMGSSVRAVAFRPGHPLVVYVGTTGGKVYRVTGPAMGPWTAATAITEDLSYTGLPVGQEISSLAVDVAGNVWASISSLLRTEAPGEFTTEHVYRLDAGATSWNPRSAGLAAANPINAIVIDPLSSTRVLCGGDRGAFLWDAALGTWTPWDQGLPNAPVVKLVIHGPSRKIRAATYGRGVWERSLDDVACPNYFLYFRDNLTDSGAIPSPDGVPHPYLSGELCWHWQSEDIIVDPAPFQSTGLLDSPTQLARNVVHLGGRRGANRAYVTVHNKGPFAVTNVRVRAFFAPASAGLPPFPSGLLGNPFTWTPGPGVSSGWNPVGSAFSIARIEAGTTRMARWEFVIPASAPRHSCLLAFVTSDEDPFAAAGISNPDLLVVNNRKVTLKNLDLDAMPGTGGAGGSGTGGGSTPPGFTQPVEIWMHAGQREKGYGQAAFCGRLPNDAVVVLALHKKSAEAFRRTESKLSANARRAAEKFRQFKKFPKEYDQFDLVHPIVVDAGHTALSILGETPIAPGQPIRVALWVHSRRWSSERTYTVDFVQLQGSTPMGGYTLTLANPEMLRHSEGECV